MVCWLESKATGYVMSSLYLSRSSLCDFNMSQPENVLIFSLINQKALSFALFRLTTKSLFLMFHSQKVLCFNARRTQALTKQWNCQELWPYLWSAGWLHENSQGNDVEGPREMQIFATQDFVARQVGNKYLATVAIQTSQIRATIFAIIRIGWCAWEYYRTNI